MHPLAEELAHEIRRYCRLNPHARDSLEGIAWWIAFQHMEEARGQLQTVIDDLVIQGNLRRQQNSDGSVIFACANCNSQPEAEQNGAAHV
jgi:hypothetical protein